MTKPNLRAVKADEQPTAPKKLTVAQAAASGDHRSLLVSMRERIAVTVSNPDCPPRDLAALTRRLQEIAKEIEAIDLARAEEEADGVTGSAEDEAWDAAAL